MKMHLTVKFDDGSAVSTDAATADFVAFEEMYDKSITTLTDNFKLRDVCYLAWHALHRRDSSVPPFTDWLSNVDEVIVGQEESAEAPLGKGRRSSS